MKDDVRLLEDLVGRAVERLKRLEVEPEGAASAAGASRAAAPTWEAERERVREALQEAISELEAGGRAGE